MRFRNFVAVASLVPIAAGCSVHDSRVAQDAQSRMIGMSEVDVETCLGAPDQHQSFGATDILTYYTASSSSMSFALPIVGGPSLSNGGNCHMTLRLDNQAVTRILYSGEKNDTGAPSAYCAPIVRSCLDALDSLGRQKGQAYQPAKGAPPA